MDVIEYDVRNITPADYSAEYTITQDIWDTFLRDVYSQTPMYQGRAEVWAFRHYLKREFERLLTQVPHQDKDDDVSEVEVADITFAFNNAKIIKMLRKRGKFIRQ